MHETDDVQKRAFSVSKKLKDDSTAVCRRHYKKLEQRFKNFTKQLLALTFL